MTGAPPIAAPEDPICDGPVLVIDAGTGSVKTAVVAPDGTLIGVADAPYTTSSPRQGWHEQAPEDWWAATVHAILSTAGAHKASAVVATGAMQSVIPLDRDRQPIRPALMYSDGRAGAIAARLSDALAHPALIKRLGNPPGVFSSALKWRWLAEEEPETAYRTRHILFGTKDFLVARMTGRCMTDPTTATTTAFLDLHQGAWDSEMLELAALQPELLPELAPANAVAGSLLPAAAKRLGLQPGIPVLNGCGDAGAATLGSIVHGYETYAYLGSSAWVARVAPMSLLAAPRETFLLAHPQDACLIDISPMMSGGEALVWLQTLFGDLDTLSSQARDLYAEPPALLFLPFLKGERAPIMNADLRAAFFGLDWRHGIAEMTYAVLEGLAFLIRANLDLLPAKQDPLVITGGGARGALLVQLIADATGRPARSPYDPQLTTALGAARLALGSGVFRHQAEGEPVTPNAERVERMEARYRTFLKAARFAEEIAPLP